MVEEEEKKHRPSLSRMLNYLGVSRTGYNSWLNRKPSKTDIHRQKMKEKIAEIHTESKEIYGAPKIWKVLSYKGFHISQRTVGVYMKQMNIKANWIKKFKAGKLNTVNEELKNILRQNFNPSKPNAVWCTDITYIWTAEGFVYLTSVMDLFSRKIIAWTLSETLEASHVVETINKAKRRRRHAKAVIIHSDRGSQYISNEYRKATKKMKRSYSAPGYPYDNACIEAFHSVLKREWIYRFQIEDYEQAYQLIFEYIETFYNTKRLHSHCDYMSPDDFERLHSKSRVCCQLAV